VCCGSRNDPLPDGADRPRNVALIHYHTSVADGAQVPAGRETTVRGIAFDGGYASRRSRFRPTGRGSVRAALWAMIWAATLPRMEAGNSTFTPPRQGTVELKVVSVNRSARATM